MNSPEFHITVKFDVYCTCGAGLCQKSEAFDYYPGDAGRKVVVEPCRVCMACAAEHKPLPEVTP